MLPRYGGRPRPPLADGRSPGVRHHRRHRAVDEHGFSAHRLAPTAHLSKRRAKSASLPSHRGDTTSTPFSAGLAEFDLITAYAVQQPHGRRGRRELYCGAWRASIRRGASLLPPPSHRLSGDGSTITEPTPIRGRSPAGNRKRRSWSILIRWLMAFPSSAAQRKLYAVCGHEQLSGGVPVSRRHRHHAGLKSIGLNEIYRSLRFHLLSPAALAEDVPLCGFEEVKGTCLDSHPGGTAEEALPTCARDTPYGSAKRRLRLGSLLPMGGGRRPVPRRRKPRMNPTKSNMTPFPPIGGLFSSTLRPGS